MHRLKYQLMLLAALSVAGCSRAGDAKVPSVALTDDVDSSSQSSASRSGSRSQSCVDHSYVATNTTNEVSKKISDFLSASPDCTVDNSTEPKCTLVQKSLSFGDPWCQSVGQRVLIIEPDIDQIAMRWQNRVLGSYQWDSVQGTYSPSHRTLGLQSGLYEILSDIIGKSGQFVPSMYFLRAPYQDDPTAKYNDPDFTGDHHGFNIVNLLMDYNPNAQFVFADTPTMPKNVLCSDDTQKVTSYYTSTFAALDAVIKNYGVSWINLSSGQTKDLIQASYRTACGREIADPYATTVLKGYANFLTMLGGDAVLVQAAMNSADDTPGQDDPQYFADCSQVNGRVRVGFTTSQTPGIGAAGGDFASFQSLLSAPQKNVANCVDLFVNTGWDERLVDAPKFGDYPLLFNGDGLYGGPLFRMSTSFAAPAGLSYLLHYEQVLAAAGVTFQKPQDVVDAIVQAGKKPLFVDPARYDQLETCRLYPQFCANWSSYKIPGAN